MVWGCLACLEPHWPWRLREGCYMLAPNRVGSTLHLHRSGAAASMHHFALMASSGLLCMSLDLWTPVHIILIPLA